MKIRAIDFGNLKFTLLVGRKGGYILWDAFPSDMRGCGIICESTPLTVASQSYPVILPNYIFLPGTFKTKDGKAVSLRSLPQDVIVSLRLAADMIRDSPMYTIEEEAKRIEIKGQCLIYVYRRDNYVGFWYEYLNSIRLHTQIFVPPNSQPNTIYQNRFNHPSEVYKNFEVACI